MRHALGILPGLLLLAALSGCYTSAYVDDYRYRPRPALAEVQPSAPDQASPAMVQASIIGIRRADSNQGIPTCVEVRLQVENNGPQTLVFDPATLSLTTGDLVRFPPPLPPLLRPPQPLTLAPTESAVVSAFFPFPPGRDYDNIDLNSLQLRWVLQLDKRRVSQTINFYRCFPVYRYYDDYGPYYYYPGYPWYGVYGGVYIRGGYYHRWR